MTPQEAIERLRKIPVRPKPDNALDLLAIIMAVKALEKQIPKKPLDICTPVVTWGLCPICKGELNKLLGNQPHRLFINTKYCPDCGQALDWSDNNV